MYLPNSFIEYKLDAFHICYLILIKSCPKLSLTALKFPEFCHLRVASASGLSCQNPSPWKPPPDCVCLGQLSPGVGLQLGAREICVWRRLEGSPHPPRTRKGFEGYIQEVLCLYRGLCCAAHLWLSRFNCLFLFLTYLGGRCHTAQDSLDLIMEPK